VSYFFCDWCKRAYRLHDDWSEADALAERAKHFGSPKKPTDATLCEDCYAELLKRMARARGGTA